MSRPQEHPLPPSQDNKVLPKPFSPWQAGQDLCDEETYKSLLVKEWSRDWKDRH